MEIDDDLVEAMGAEQLDDVANDGLVDDRHHRLGCGARERVQARAHAGGKNHGLHAVVALRGLLGAGEWVGPPPERSASCPQRRMLSATWRTWASVSCGWT